MPLFGFGKSSDEGAWKSPYRDLEHAPLSAAHDDEDDMPLPPYSDKPGERNGSADDDDDDVSGGLNGGRNGNGGAGGRNGRRSNKKGSPYRDDPQDSKAAIAINRGGEYNDEGYGEGDWACSGHSSATPSKYRRGHRGHNGGGRSPSRYRGNLVCAYMKHWLTCGCCDGSDPRSSDSRCKRFLMILFYICILIAIVASASGIGYILAQDGSPFTPDESTTVGDGSNSSSGNQVMIGGGKKLPPPPVNLHDICNDWITTLGRANCQAECGVADCCTLPASDKASCWQDQADDCATYRSACMALELHDTGDEGDDGDDGVHAGSLPSEPIHLESPKPSYLDQVCGTDSLETPNGFDNCSKLCRPTRCCHPETFGCSIIESDKRWCPAYEIPCASVAESWRGSGHATALSSDMGKNPEHTTISASVIMECNSGTLTSPTDCIEACHPGACCYVSKEYLPIEQLFDEYYGPNASPMKTVDSCSSNVGFCQQYGACEQLNNLKDTSGWHSDETTYELDIASVCQPEYIAQFGALECSNVCQPAHCCFSGEYKCEDMNLSDLNCIGVYAVCGVLYPSVNKATSGTGGSSSGGMSTKELFQMAKQIDEICSEESLSKASGRAGCQDMCKDRLCCFEDGDYGCSNDPNQNCLAHAGCETLVSTPPAYYENNDPTSGGTTDKSDKGGDFITELETACAPSNLKHVAGFKQCHDKCQTHLCCFTDDVTVAGDCKIHPDACEAYTPCERLVTPTGEASPSNFDASEYDDPMDQLADQVEKACEPPEDPYLINQNWVTGCHNVCASRLCCLLDAKIGSNCRAAVGTRECNAYGPCEILINSSGKEITQAKGIEDKLGDVNAVCGADVETTPQMYDSCEERCSQRSCCFEEEVAYSCYHMEKDWCDEFKACDVVDFRFTPEALSPATATTKAPPVTTTTTTSTTLAKSVDEEVDEFLDALETACSEANLKTLEGIKQCHDKCQAHLCCFTENSVVAGEDCTNIHPGACSAYKPCERLVTPSVDNPLGSYSQDSFEEIAEKVEQTCELPDQSGIDQKWVTECHSICASHLCCLVDARMGSNCRSTVGIQECNAYSTCEVLINSSGKEMTQAKDIEDKYGGIGVHDDDAIKNIEDIGAICPGDVGRDPKRKEACKEQCSERSCCFESKPEYSCYHMEQEWCDEYKACYVVDLHLHDFSEKDPANPPKAGLSQSNSNNAKQTFKDLCNTINIENNWDTCKEHCSEFACCFDSHNSCYANKGMECDEYFICEEFFPGDGAPTIENSAPAIGNNSPAPKLDAFLSGLEADCSSQSLKTLHGVEHCFNKCQAHLCCHPADAIEDEKFDCSDTMPECNPYSACESLVSSYNLWKPPSTAFDQYAVTIAVNDACNHLKNSATATEQAVAKCHQVCEARMCCLTDSKHGSCVDAVGEKECGDYSACNVLIGGEFLTDVRDLCHEEVSSDKELFADCRKLCQTRSCCFEDEPAYSCYGMDKEWCDEYEVCNLVGLTFLGAAKTVGQTNQAASTSLGQIEFDQIDTKCSEQYAISFGFDECESLCNPLKCCFGFSQCEYPNQSDCDRTSACNNFFNPTKNDLILEKLCSDEELMQDTGPCSDACEPYQCCFNNSPCPAQVDDKCKEYQPCKYWYEEYDPNFEPGSVSSGPTQEFYMDEEELNTSPATTTTTSTTTKAPPVTATTTTSKATPVPTASKTVEEEVLDFLGALEKACSETNLRSLDGIKQCHDKCQTHLCCFTENSAVAGEDCTNIHPDACAAYKPCERLVTSNVENPVDASTTSSLEELAEKVEELCDLPDDTFSIDQSWVSGCHGVCAPRLCCLVDARMSSNCRSAVGIQECNAYSPCEVLISSNGHEMTEDVDFQETYGTIESICSADVANDISRHDECFLQCQTRSCCFEPEPEYSCFEMEKEWCDEYKACYVVDLHLSTNTLTAPAVSAPAAPTISSNNAKQSFKDLCSPSTIDQNRDTCKSHCSEFICCFGDEDSCYNEKRLECEEYYICEEFCTPNVKEEVASPSATESLGPGSEVEAEVYGSLEAMNYRCSSAHLERYADKCLDWCGPYECCFYHSNVHESCAASHKAECDVHEICKSVFEDAKP